MTRGWALAIVLLAVGAFAVAGLAIVLVQGNEEIVVELDPGDCFDLPDEIDDEIRVVDTVDCDDPHEAEVVAASELNAERDLDYPGDEIAVSTAQQRCDAELAGESALLADFGIVPVVSNQEAWEALEGRYVCVAIPYGGGTTVGSLR